MIGEELRELVNAAARKAQDQRIELARARAAAETEMMVAATRDDALWRKAVDVGHEVFDWADGQDGRQLRLLLAYTGLDVLAMSSNIGLVPEAKHVRVWRRGCSGYGGIGRVDRNVASVVEMVQIAGAEDVVSLVADIRTGRFPDVLTERLRSGS